jgi:hypothetical protein
MELYGHVSVAQQREAVEVLPRARLRVIRSPIWAAKTGLERPKPAQAVEGGSGGPEPPVYANARHGYEPDLAPSCNAFARLAEDRPTRVPAMPSSRSTGLTRSAALL